MRSYSSTITLSKNQRGVYSLDTIFGCNRGILNNPKGCYNGCYSARIAKKYGYDFGVNVLRSINNENHIVSIIKKINKIDMPFVRIGSNGDPSCDWEHTIKICKFISECKKKIVIITKHWNILTDKQLDELMEIGVYFNTSISALDSNELLNNRIDQYKRIPERSILRILSCDFNLGNQLGNKLSRIQTKLFDNNKVIDTIFRVYKKNPYVLNGVINIEKVKFMGKPCHVSRFNNETYFGHCSNCPEMCGINF